MPPATDAERVIQPATIGRIVHLHPNAHHRKYIDEMARGNPIDPTQPVPAVIVRVWGPEMVNLKVLTDGKHDVWLTSIGSETFKGPDESPNSYWSWPARVGA